MRENDAGGLDSGDGSRRNDSIRWEQATQRPYDPNQNVELTNVIVFAIADAEGVSPNAVKSPSLYEIVDVAAIEQAFFGNTPEGDARNSRGSAEFRYSEYLVKIRSDGWVQIYEQTGSEQV